MDPMTIAAIVSMIAGAGLQYKAQSDAAQRAREQALISQRRQLDAQNQATAAASKRAQEFDPTAREQQQQQIQQDLTNRYDQQVSAPQITAQGVQVGSTVPDGASSDYTLAKAKEEAKTKSSLHALAGLMARIGSASQLRQNEAVGIGDTAGEIGRIQTGANNIAGIDQIGINAAGQPSLGLQLAGAALSAYGMNGIAKAGIPDATKTGGPTAPGPLGSGTWYPKSKGGALGSGTWLPPGSAF